MINVELLQKTLDTIKANPSHWKQDSWHCGTSHCFAGFVELIANDIPIDISDEDLSYLRYKNNMGAMTSTNAEKLLGITSDDSDILFFGYNSLKMLEVMVAHLIEYGSLDNFATYSDLR